MKQYPSILGPNQAPHLPCVAFFKYDGSNLRFEWSPKRGWHKFGAKKTMFDATHETWGPSIDIFMNKYADGIEKIIRDNKAYRNAQYATAFCEYYGPRSFAGYHEAGDKMELMFFDIQIYKKGFLGPREFINEFADKLETAKVVYEGNLNASFIEAVRASKVDDGQMGLNEGVICKGGKGHEIWMRKVKTNDYFARLKAKFVDTWEEYGE